jgi:hypothetical protein
MNTYIGWCSSCGQNLIQLAIHCCPAASTVCVTFTFAEPHNSAPKRAHEHFNDLLNIAYIVSHAITDFLDCFMGGLQALATFSRFICPQIIPHKLAFGETCTFVHAVHRPSLLKLKIYQETHSITCFSDTQTELVLFCSGKNGFYVLSFGVLLKNMPNATIHASPRHATLHGLLSRTSI